MLINLKELKQEGEEIQQSTISRLRVDIIKEIKSQIRCNFGKGVLKNEIRIRSLPSFKPLLVENFEFLSFYKEEFDHFVHQLKQDGIELEFKDEDVCGTKLPQLIKLSWKVNP